MIRKAIESDAKAIHELHLRAVRESCNECYSEEQINGWLKNRTSEGYLNGIKKNEMYVVEIDNKIAGFGHAEPGEIYAIYVDPIFHKKGFGKLLLEYGLDIAKSKNHKKIKVKATLNAVDFYKKHGFHEIGESTIERGGQKLPIILMEM